MEESHPMNNPQPPSTPEAPKKIVRYHGGTIGALLPFIIFIVGVIAVSLSGAPDEKGFWPILILALSAGLLLARDRKAFSEIVIKGMSQEIVMIMIMAWILASTIGVLMSATGFIEALIWIASQIHLNGTTFVIATFFICIIVSISIGTSFGTILICGPILYPAGGLMGANLAALAGAIIGGATFSDNMAPISDTTIAGALSQKADVGGTVRSRLKYILPTGAIAAVLYFISASLGKGFIQQQSFDVKGSPRGLPMILVTIVIIALLLSGRSLLQGLLMGLMAGVVIGLVFGLLPLEKLFSLDLQNLTAKSVVIDGINRAVGISFFTILLIGLVATIEASGLLQRLVDFAAKRCKSVRSAEMWIVGAVALIVLLTGHAVVAILTIGEFARQTGERMGIHRYRRANLLTMTVSSFPFILPYFIPVILAANTTKSGADFGIPPVSPLQVGLHNFMCWVLLAMVIFALLTGYGRRVKEKNSVPPSCK